MLNLNNVLSPRTPDVVADVIEGDAVIINVLTSVYYSTEGLGGWVWEQCAMGCSLHSILGALAERYESPPAVFERDLSIFAEDLIQQALVHERSATSSGPAPTPPVRAAYEAPKLLSFHELKDLLALDPPMPRFTAQR